MTFDWLYSLGDWNPQLFREAKGHLKRRTLTFTCVTSIMLQLLLLVLYGSALPEELNKNNYYCASKSESSYMPDCIKDAAGNVMVNWQRWWFDIFQILSWAIPFILLIAGVYLLISDLAKEERRGTFNFIRLSPRSSQTILLGKVLGVPIIPYVAVALAIPLHLLAAMGAKVSLLAVVGIDLFTLAVCSFFYVGALLFAFLGGSQGWVGAIVISVVYFTFLQIWQSARYARSAFSYLGLGQWFGFDLTALRLALPFALITFGVGTYWLWQAVNRRFRNPDATLLSKRQSYLMTACFEVWMLGFVSHDRALYGNPLEALMVVTLVNLVWFLLLAAALLPQRQTLLDWARYRRERTSSGQFWSRSLVHDLAWGGKSPAVFAIGLNLALTIALFTPWILSWSDAYNGTADQLRFQGYAGLLINALSILICVTIAQMMMFLKSPKRAIWAAATVGGFVVLPPFLLGVLSVSPTADPVLWALTAFSFVTFPQITAFTVGFSFLCQFIALTALTLRFSQQLRKAGESELKALMGAAKA